ncbi:uncharacterized protein [Diabrotica undecimpunctata]|uniref:uncharacterized protein n=1 Tax=Diabrotica undecimpunctata TaxID=50387 RepID=UPI003B637B54
MTGGLTKLQCGDHDLIEEAEIIQFYAPTSSHTDEEVEIFYESLTQTVNKYKSTYTIIICDFNDKLGRKLEESENKIGNFGYGTRNKRGETLINYMETNGQYATNIFFDKKLQRKWTWIAPNGSTKNEIDYILSKEKNIVQEVAVINMISVVSDHRIIRAKIKINATTDRQKFKPSKKEIDTELLKERKEQYINQLKRSDIPQLQDLQLDELNDKITTELLEAGLKIANKQKRKQQKISTKSQNMLKKRGQLLNDNKRNTVEFTELNKTIRKQIKEDLKKYQEDRIKKIIEKNKSLKTMKTNKGKRKLIMPKAANNEERDLGEIVNITERYYTDLYSSKNDSPLSFKQNLSRKIQNVGSEILPEITEDEIEKSINDIKRNKAAGEDKILAELLKEGGDTIKKMLKILCIKDENIKK